MDLVSNNVSSGRHPHRVGRTRRHPSSTTSLSSRSSSSSSHSSTSTNSVERRSSSHQKHSNSKHASKSTKKPLKSTNNAKASTKKASSTKEQSIKSSQRSRPGKDEEPSTTQQHQQQQQQQPDIIILPSLSLGEQIESIKKDPPTTKQPSASPKAASKNTERVFDWLMQNHQQDSNSSMGLDQNDDEDNLIKSKLDDDSLENVSDEQTSKASPPMPNNHHSASSSSTPLTPSALTKNGKIDKAALPSSYRLQPIRAGGKRDEQSDNSLIANDTHLSSSPPPTPAPPVPQVTLPPPAPLTPTPLSAPPVPVIKEESEPTSANPRRVNRTKNPFGTNQMKKIPLDCHVSYDQLDVRLKSYPSLFADHIESIRLPFPQFAFEHIKTSATASNVLVVLNPKAHLKHSSLGLNNPSTSTTKHETSIDTNNNTSAVTNSNDDELSTARIPLDERIRLLDKQMNEMNHGPQKSATSSSSSSSSSSLSPATLIEQQNLKSSAAAGVKSVNDLALSLSSSTSSATLNQCIQAARAALIAQPPAKTPLPMPASSPFSFPVTPVPSLALNRPLSVTSPSVLVAPPPPPFPSLQRLPDPASHSILTTFHAALAQTQLAKYNSL